MKLVIPAELIERLRRELRHAGSREIGGVLVGEHLHGDVFRLADLSVQRLGGSQSHFVRDLQHNKAFLAEFFARTGNNFVMFNYLGEWHSHPSFSVIPSGQDLTTMQNIVEDPNVGTNFAVMLIVSLRRRGPLELSASAFRPSASPEQVEVLIEEESTTKEKHWFAQIIGWFRL